MLLRLEKQGTNDSILNGENEIRKVFSMVHYQKMTRHVLNDENKILRIIIEGKISGKRDRKHDILKKKNDFIGRVKKLQ